MVGSMYLVGGFFENLNLFLLWVGRINAPAIDMQKTTVHGQLKK